MFHALVQNGVVVMVVSGINGMVWRFVNMKIIFNMPMISVSAALSQIIYLTQNFNGTKACAGHEIWLIKLAKTKYYRVACTFSLSRCVCVFRYASFVFLNHLFNLYLYLSPRPLSLSPSFARLSTMCTKCGETNSQTLDKKKKMDYFWTSGCNRTLSGLHQPTSQPASIDNWYKLYLSSH